MSSIFSTQKRHIFLRRKYCFLVTFALSPPVGRIDEEMGRPPFCSAMVFTPYLPVPVRAPPEGAQWIPALRAWERQASGPRASELLPRERPGRPRAAAAFELLSFRDPFDAFRASSASR